MSFLGSALSVKPNIGCDNDCFIARPKPPVNGCDTDGLTAKPKINVPGCDTPDKGGIAGKSNNQLLQTLALLAASNSCNNLYTPPPVPTYVVPPMMDPGFPAGIMM